MSADSLRKQSKQAYHGQVILPQAINDPSIIESVAGFIHEVVPQAYSSVLPGESRDGILWARFDSTDYNDPENFPPLSECESESTIPLLLVLGYSSGVQVWSVGGSGEATELLSWCQGAVRALRFLLKPYNRDPHASKRPLVAIVDSSSPGPQFSTLSFISLKTAEVVKIIKFNSPICDVHCNRKSIVVTFNERIAVFDSATLEDRLTITTCYLSPGNSPNPIALGTRWLAYGEKRLTTWQRSSGGCEGDGAQSYTSAVIHAAKSLGKGLRELGGSLTGSSPQSSQNAHAQPGIVSIIDIERKGGTSEEERGNMIAHFVAHTSAVVAMAFDPSGLLLITADRHGHRFNVFRIHPHPCTSQLAAVHHLYILHRGETTARVQDIAVSWDSRWVAISSVRGTTHVFPITPYGGLVTVRTHTTPHVVNRLSRFERSAGLRDGRGSPLPCEAPPTPPPPRLPPYPHPSVITPLAQLRARPDDSPLAATFGPPRAWLPGRPKSKRTCADSLYVISNSGVLLQYDLDPKCVQGIAKEKISYDTAIEVGVEAKAEWVLPKPPYTSSLCPPLPPGHVFLDLPPRPQPPPDKWLSQVEIVTHTGPHRRLWMGPQFTFKSIDPLPSSGYEEGGMDSGNPLRSNPVNMPHRPYLLVETSSGGSVGSPQTDTDEAGGRLREDLADAMLETQLGSGQARGKLRRAEVEWQVNPLGAVQTHPVAVVSHWPHPIFYEPFPVKISKDEHQAADTISRASLDNKKSEETSDIIVDPSNSENVISYSSEKLEKQPSGDIDILKFDVDDSEVFVNESLVEKEMADSKTEIHCSLQPKELRKSNANRNTPSSSVSNSEPLNDSSKDQSEISSSDKEGALSIEKGALKTEEVEEKCSKVVSKKGRKKRKKDLSKPSSTKDDNISCITQIDDNKMQHEPFLENTTTNELLVITDKGSSKQIKTASEEQDIDLSLSLKDKIELNQSSSSLLIQLEPLQEIELNFLGDDPPPSEVNPTDEPCFEEIQESSIETLPHSNPIIEPSFVSDNLQINISYAEEIAILEDDPNAGERTNESCDLISDKIAATEEKCSVSDIDDSHLMDLKDIAIVTVPEGDIEPSSYKDVSIEGAKSLSEEMHESFLESDLNGNRPPMCTVNQEKCQEESFQIEDQNSCSSISNEQLCEVESFQFTEPLSIPAEDSSENFTKVTAKNGRNNKNKRRKKDKKTHDSTLLADINEVDSCDFVATKAEMDTKDSPENLSSEVETDVLTPVTKETDNSNITLSDVTSACKTVEDKGNLINPPEMNEGAVEDSIKCLSVTGEVPLLFSEDIQSDQIASTDKSEVEDISSHSGKESDDSKINKKERSRKQKRSESSDKDRSDKKKSPSPATARAEVKDSESSDESSQVSEAKIAIQKVPKRKKGKKNEEASSELQLKVKESSEMIDTIPEGPKDKSSDSSNEYSSEKPTRKQSGNRSWSNVVSIGDQRCSNIEDRDSVYESCNDDGASDSLAFESSKEDFDESALKAPPLEMTSSNTEERTDSSDKLNQVSSKKLRKQKKKKR